MPVLTTQQQRAVQSDAKVLKILATAGSGKTTVLIERMQHLLRTYPGQGILGITFTRKAGAELDERLPKPRPISISCMTFGQLARGICMSAHPITLVSLGYQMSQLRIIDTIEETQIVKMLMNRHHIGVGDHGLSCGNNTNMRSEAEGLLEDGLHGDSQDPDSRGDSLPEMCQWIRDMRLRTAEMMKLPELSPEFEQFLGLYDTHLKQNGKMDLACMSRLAVQVLTKEPNLKQKYRHQYRHVLADEFQDSSPSQIELLQLLHDVSDQSSSLTVVGDDDQAIYSWRGGSGVCFEKLSELYPHAEEQPLEVNFRSTRAIVAAASALIAENSKRVPKKLQSANKQQCQPIGVMRPQSAQKEAEMVGQHICELKQRGIKYEDIAILYRCKKDSHLVQEELKKRKIPLVWSKTTKKVSSYKKDKSVKQGLSLLLLVGYSADNDAPSEQLDEAFNVVASSSIVKGLGRKTLETLQDASKHAGNPQTMWGCALTVSKQHAYSATASCAHNQQHNKLQFIKFSATVNSALEELVHKVEELQQQLLHGTNVEEAVRNVMQMVGASSAKQVWKELLQDAAVHRYSCGLEPLASIGDFAQSMQGQAQETSKKRFVTLSTIHASKGLEFNVVILLRWNEGSVPMPARSGDESAIRRHLEEERRLAYVSMTRARTQLYITALKGGEMVSSFLQNMPDCLLGNAKYTQEAVPITSLDQVEASNRSLYEKAVQNRAKRNKPDAGCVTAAERVCTRVPDPHANQTYENEIQEETAQLAQKPKPQEVMEVPQYICMMCASTAVENDGDLCDGCSDMETGLEHENIQSIQQPQRRAAQQQRAPEIPQHSCVVCVSTRVEYNGGLCNDCSDIGPDPEYDDGQSTWQQQRPEADTILHPANPTTTTRGSELQQSASKPGNWSGQAMSTHCCKICRSSIVSGVGHLCDVCRGIDMGSTRDEYSWRHSQQQQPVTQTRQRRVEHLNVACNSTVVKEEHDLCDGCKQGLYDADLEPDLKGTQTGNASLCAECNVAPVLNYGQLCESCSVLESHEGPDTSNKPKLFRCVMCDVIKSLKESTMCNDCLTETQGDLDDCSNEFEVSQFQSTYGVAQSPQKDIINLISKPNSPVCQQSTIPPTPALVLPTRPQLSNSTQPFQFWRPQMVMFSGSKRARIDELQVRTH